MKTSLLKSLYDSYQRLLNFGAVYWNLHKQCFTDGREVIFCRKLIKFKTQTR